MREFICGYQTLLACSGELFGFAIFLLLLVIAGWIAITERMAEGRLRKRTPHPETCSTVMRCAGAGRCWMVPSCKRNQQDYASGVGRP